MRIANKAQIMGALALMLAAVAANSAHAQEVIKAAKVAQLRAPLDPDAAIWKSARDVRVTMQPQIVTVPMNPEPAIVQIHVRAMHNGKWLALRLQWKDPTRSDVLTSDTFGDQAAIEFPIEGTADTLPTPMMGNAGGRVNILQWRAALQRDLLVGEPTIRTLYPNALVDVYPDQILTAISARPYQGAMALDNPISRAHASPVLDQVAEGWGTLTIKLHQQGDGRGVWRDGQWTVVIALPMNSQSADSPKLAPGTKTVVAFAVWEGGRREVGSRKSWSDWTPVELSK